MLLVFLDTETTGIDPTKHRIIDISLKVVNPETFTTLSSYNSLISQPPEIWDRADPQSIQFVGMTFEELKMGKPEEVVAQEIATILNGCRLKQHSGAFLCQNPSFDRAFFSQLISVQQQSSF